MSDQKKEKKYLKSSVKEPSFAHKTGDLLNINLNLEELQAIVNSKGWVNITVSRRREVDEYGNSHYVTVNDFVPNKDYMSKPKTPQSTSEDPVEDLPF